MELDPPQQLNLYLGCIHRQRTVTNKGKTYTIMEILVAASTGFFGGKKSSSESLILNSTPVSLNNTYIDDFYFSI